MIIGKNYDPTKLTNKQKVFVAEYLTDFNAKRAAIAAGVKSDQAGSVGCQWLNADRFPAVANEVKRMLEERRATASIDARRVVEELTKIALFNPKSMLDKDGNLLELNQMPDYVACCIKSIEASVCVEDDEMYGLVKMKRLKLQFHDKMNALEQIAKHLGLLKDIININQVVQVVDWDKLYKVNRPASLSDDALEEKIASVRGGRLLVDSSSKTNSELVDSVDS